MQSKKHSFIEAVSNTIISYWLSILVNVFLFPMLDIEVSFTKNCIIVAVFSIVSIIRNYFIRRYFNSKVKHV